MQVSILGEGKYELNEKEKSAFAKAKEFLIDLFSYIPKDASDEFIAHQIRLIWDKNYAVGEDGDFFADLNDDIRLSVVDKNYHILNGSADTKELRREKSAILGDQEKTEILVAKYYKKSDFDEIRYSENNIYITVPSTSGGNFIPLSFAKKLKSDFGGDMIVGDKFFKAKANDEAKNKRAFIKKLEDPSEFEIKKNVTLPNLSNKNIVIIVDDTFTTGETVLGFRLALKENGIIPSMAVTLGQSTKELSIAKDEDYEAFAKKISALTNTNLDENLNIIKIALGGASQALLNKAADETVNRATAKKIRGLLAERAGKIRYAQKTGNSRISKRWQAQGQLGQADIQNPRGKNEVQGLSGNTVRDGSGKRSSFGDSVLDDETSSPRFSVRANPNSEEIAETLAKKELCAKKRKLKPSGPIPTAL